MSGRPRKLLRAGGSPPLFITFFNFFSPLLFLPILPKQSISLLLTASPATPGLEPKLPSNSTSPDGTIKGGAGEPAGFQPAAANGDLKLVCDDDEAEAWGGGDERPGRCPVEAGAFVA